MTRTTLSVATMCGAAALVSLTGPAGAAPRCGDRAALVRQLQDKYGETQRSVGLSGGAKLFEIFVSEDTGTWTILLSDPRGTSCLMAAGRNWQPVAPVEPETPA